MTRRLHYGFVFNVVFVSQKFTVRPRLSCKKKKFDAYQAHVKAVISQIQDVNNSVRSWCGTREFFKVVRNKGLENVKLIDVDISIQSYMGEGIQFDGTFVL